jgi:transcriptional regulator
MRNGEHSGIKAHSKRQQVKRMLDLRLAGKTLEEIAEEMEFSVTYISKTIKKALEEVTKSTAQDVVALETARLDALWYKMFIKATSGTKVDHNAVKSCLNIMERRAKLLGLDKPSKIAHTDPAGEQEVVTFYLPDNGRMLSE